MGYAQGSVYHVQIRSRRGFRRAWEFNLDEHRLRRDVVDLWLAGEPLTVGDRDWEPRHSEMRIFHGRRLAPHELGHGQGPGAVERSGTNVTRQVLAEAKPAVSPQPADESAAALIQDLNALEGVSIQGDEALDLVAERLRGFGVAEQRVRLGPELPPLRRG